MSATQSDSSRSSTHGTPSSPEQLQAVEKVTQFFELIVQILKLLALLNPDGVIKSCLFCILYVPYVNATLAFLATNRHVTALPGRDQIKEQVRNR
jgi:hypothetical protein